MTDTDLQRLTDYDRRRYWLSNGWCIRFRVKEHPVSGGRPHGIKYSFTLHDATMARLLGFDNAHGVPRVETYDHSHRFRRTDELVPYDYRSGDQLISDFFAAVEMACRVEGIEVTFDSEEVELEEGDDDEENSR